jgi:small-conductance mechanosensitive channel
MQFAQTDINIDKTKNVLEQISSALFNLDSLLTLAASLLIATVVGAIVSFVLRKISKFVARRADVSKNLTTVNRLRRVETWMILSIAAIRMALLIFAVYFWWVVTHDGPNTNALIGASALAIVVIGGIFGPMLRDFAFGAGMMAEQWFGVGDLVTIDFPAVQGVVERITLRSTRLRGLNGEVIWVANQTMNGVRVAQKGVPNDVMVIRISCDDFGGLIDTHLQAIPLFTHCLSDACGGIFQ